MFHSIFNSFPVEHLPTLSYLALYSFCANLLHSLTTWTIVSSLSLYNLNLLLRCVLLLSLLFLSLSCNFRPSLADCISLESEWQQVPSNHKDSSQYSSWFQQCFTLNFLGSSSDFKFQLSFQDFRVRCKSSNLNGYNSHPLVLRLSQFSGKVKVLDSFLLTFIFTLGSVGTAKSNRQKVPFFS